VKNPFKIIIETVLVVILVLAGGFSRPGSVLGTDTKPFSVEGSYSVQEKAGFKGEYRLDRFSMGLRYDEERWRAAAGIRLVPGLKLEVGFDLTQDSYMAGFNHRWRIGENLLACTEVTGFWPRKYGRTYYDYDTRLDIGIGEDNTVSPGLRGDYEPGSGHNPELYLLFNFNWYLRNDLHLKFEPLILVEGGFNHRTTLTKKFGNKWKTGFFFGQNRDYKWDIGAFITY